MTKGSVVILSAMMAAVPSAASAQYIPMMQHPTLQLVTQDVMFGPRATFEDDDEGSDDAGLGTAPTDRARPAATARTAPQRGATWRFVPSAAIRDQSLRRFVGEVLKVDPVGADALAHQFVAADPIVGLDPMIARHGLRTDDLIDAMTLFVIVSLEAADGVLTDGSRRQALGVRAVLADGFADSRAAPPPADELQRMTDRLLLQAILVSQFNSQAQTDPTIRAAVRQGAAGLRKIGFDPDAIRLTPDGLALAR